MRWMILVLIATSFFGCNKNDPSPFTDRTDEFIVINKAGISAIPVEIKACGNKTTSGTLNVNQQLSFKCRADFSYTGEVKANKPGVYVHTWSDSFPADEPAATYQLHLTTSGIVLIN